MALGKRCGSGCETWPNTDEFDICPICNEKTILFRDVEPLPEKEASIRAFEVFYESYDSALNPDRLLGDAPNVLLIADAFDTSA